MSDRDNKDNNSNGILKNEDTISRRAWVDRALDGVRRRLSAGEEFPESHEADALPSPRLRVVPSGRDR